MKRTYLFLSTLVVVVLLSCNFFQEVGDEEEACCGDTDEEAGAGDEDEGDDLGDEDDDIVPVIEDELQFTRNFKFDLPLFSPDSAWNQRADQASVIPESDAQILSLYRVLIGDFDTLKGYDEPGSEWPYIAIDLIDFTIPIFLASDSMQEVYICEDEGIVGWAHPKFDIETEGGPVSVPAPARPVRPSGPEDDGADGWLVIYDPETNISYDYIGATPFLDEECYGFVGGLVGDQIRQAGVVDFFDLAGPGSSPDGYYSARAVGTPLLAGVILPEDIESGVIAHALAFAIPGPRNTSRDPYEPDSDDYFYPVSTTETDFYNTDPDSLASGQRIRLKQSLIDEEGDPIDESQFAPITVMFLEALRNYGAYLVDNAAGFTFYAEDAHTANLDLTLEEVNALIGQPADTPAPPGLTKWQILFEGLNRDLELIPFAMSPGDDEPDPESAEIEIANFEVVETAQRP